MPLVDVHVKVKKVKISTLIKVIEEQLNIELRNFHTSNTARRNKGIEVIKFSIEVADDALNHAYNLISTCRVNGLAEDKPFFRINGN